MTTNGPQRPNYYELLEIDPDAAWSDSGFLAQLDRKKAEWTRGRNHPKHALRYKSYLDMVPDIQATLQDPAKRAAEQQAARAVLSNKAQASRSQFSAELELRAAKGYLTEPEVKALLNAYGSSLGKKTVRDAVNALGLEVRQNDTPTRQRETLDTATMKGIAVNLKIVGEQTLYSFLGLARTTRTTDLHDRAAQIYADNQKQATKTAIVTARSDLAGQAMKVFGNDTMRRKYDGALDDLAFAGLGDAIQRITQGTRTIHPAQYGKLLERAREQGLDLTDAEDFIRRRAQELQVALYITDAAPVAEQARCPACGTLSSPDAANCPTCGTPLKIACPNCQQEMPTAHKACTHCGFPIGNLPNVEAMLAEARALYEDRVLDAAARIVQEARRQWSPAGVAQTLPDPLSQALAELLTAIDEARQFQTDILAELQRRIDEKYFYGARDVLREIERVSPETALDAQRKTVQDAIHRAESGLRRARKAEAEGADVVEHYRQILQECRDCQAAQEALAQTPPLPPGPLTVQAGLQMARLQWEASPSRGVSYTIVRKPGSPPIAASDGEQLATTGSTTFDDTTVIIGLPIYYAVYANREGVLSLDAARSPRALMFTAEVEALSAQVDDGLVRLRWQAPPNAVAIDVRRSDERPPATPEEGERLRVYGLNDSVDSGLENNHTYHYTVFALFNTPDGRLVRSAGMSISATPQEPPSLITGMDIHQHRRGNQRELRITWPPLSKGTAVLLTSHDAPPLQQGQVIPQDTLATYGTVQAAPTNEVTLALPSSGMLYLTPVVLFQEMAYLGPTQMYTALEDIRDLEVRNLGFALELRWTWPDGCNHAVVTYHHARFPTPADTEAARVKLTRAEYNRQGHFLIQTPAERDYYIAVFAALMQDGRELLSPGREATSRYRINLGSRITITYALSQPRRLRGPGPLTLTINAEGVGLLPEMVLIRRPDRPPIRRDDGEPVFRSPERMIDGPIATLSAELEGDGSGFYRLFLTDDNLYETRNGHIRLLLPPETEYPSTSSERGGLLSGLASGPREITCPFCFTRFNAEETLFRCGNPRCTGRTEDTTYAEFQGLVNPQTMGRVFAVGAENGLRRGRPLTTATCPDCATGTHKRVCPTCHYELLYDAGLTEERTIAIMGGRGTGKSNYIAMLINRLENEIGAQFEAGVRAMGDRTRERYERDFYTPLFRNNQVIPPTRTAGVDVATRTPLVFRITFNTGKAANLVIFDTAGEDMQSLDAISTEARYLLFADALIFLLDPMQIPAVRQTVPAKLVPPTDPGAEPEYIIGRLRELYEQEFGLRSKDKISKPVAFTLSKADMLYPLLDPGSGLFRTGEHFDALNLRDLQSIHTEIDAYLRAWLGLRFDNLVRTNFSNYHYFGVSSFGKPPEGPAGQQTVESATPIRIEDPILWIFHAFGLIKARR